jgi:hypothetical protein
MAWTIKRADLEGDWSWGPRKWTDDAWEKVIHPKLREFEVLHWSEIESFTTGGKERHRMHHPMPIDVLCTESLKRLAELEVYVDQIYRFRLGSQRRLWGFRIVNVFETLWYDPLHQIYPTDPH